MISLHSNAAANAAAIKRILFFLQYKLVLHCVFLVHIEVIQLVADDMIVPVIIIDKIECMNLFVCISRYQFLRPWKQLPLQCNLHQLDNKVCLSVSARLPWRWRSL